MRNLRPTNRFCFIWAGTLALAVSGTLSDSKVAQAREIPAATVQAQATALVEQGIDLRRNGDDLAALALFQQAEALEPNSVRLVVHLAATHQALGDWEKADAYLRRALAQGSDPYIQRHRTTLNEAKQRIDRQIGSLEVLGAPAGATVRLNGRNVGTLPLSEPLRVAAGVYTLEVSHPGYFTTTRSLALAGGRLARESLNLSLDKGQPVSLQADPASRANTISESSSAPWLGWTLAGLSAATAAATVFAYTVREEHADRWNNDAECLRDTQTRSEVCGSELDKGESAETWMIVGMATTGLLAAGAVVTFALDSDTSSSPADRATVSCGLGALSLQCAGRF